ncbi:MAG: hypothetical protein ACOX1L_04970 [Erysipelotrichaceae bacterium]|jgi:hypothetical protein
MFQWLKGNAYSMIVTLSDNYITLNNCAANRFSDIRWCLIGLDQKNKRLAIKPVTKSDIDLGLYPTEKLHRVNLGKGYARIANRNLMKSLDELTEYPLSDNAKYSATFDENDMMLIVDLTSKED